MPESGRMPTGARYELYLPPPGPTAAPCVVFLHGFQCRLEYHRGTAHALIARGIACLLVDLLPLMGFSSQTRLQRREANAKAAASYVSWLRAPANNARVDPARVMLAGHSAGGAVSLEAACALDPGSVRAVLLLDAVPWLSTIRKISDTRTISFVAPSPDQVNPNSPLAPPPRVGSRGGEIILGSIRGEPAPFNANGLVLEVLARGCGPGPNCDVKVCKAGHGDFMCARADDPGGAVGPFINCAMRCLGILSTAQIRSSIQDLVVAFCVSVLLPNGVGDADGAQAYANCVRALGTKAELAQITRDHPSMIDHLPPYLR